MKIKTWKQLLHVFSFLHKLNFENSFCFLPILSCQTSFLVLKIENCFWKQKIKGKNSYQTYPYLTNFQFSNDIAHFVNMLKIMGLTWLDKTNSIIVNRILPIHWCSISISYYASLFFPFSVFLLLLLFSLTIKPNFSCFFPNVGSICADLHMHRKILWLSNLTLAAFSPCGLHRCRPPYAWENTRKLSKKLKNKKGKGKHVEVEDHMHTESNFIFLPHPHLLFFIEFENSDALSIRFVRDLWFVWIEREGGGVE